MRTLLEVVESKKNIEITIVRRGKPMEFLEDTQVEKLVAEIEKEKEEQEAKQKPRLGQQQSQPQQ